jgi:hypothetical protein
MRKLLGLCAFAALVAAPGLAGAQSSMMSGMANGPHAYDWMIGTWTCTNSVPNALAGPATQTLTATRSATTGAIIWRYTGSNYDQYGFISYEAPTHTWWMSWAYPGGSIGNEASTMTPGKKTVWNGSIFDATNGTHFHVRDTLTIDSPTKFVDVGVNDASGSMKTDYDGTCVKS